MTRTFVSTASRVSSAQAAPADGGTSQRRCSMSPCSSSRRQSGAAGETWLACSSAAWRCRVRLTRMAKSSRPGAWQANGWPVSASRRSAIPAESAQRQHGHAQRANGADGRLGGGPVVGMAGDAGVVEDQQPAGVIPGGQPGDMRGQLGRRHFGETAVGIVQQRDGGDAECRPGLPQFPGPLPGQVGAGLVQRGRLAAGVAQNMHRGSA